jgi:hypothetical protein
MDMSQQVMLNIPVKIRKSSKTMKQKEQSALCDLRAAETFGDWKPMELSERLVKDCYEDGSGNIVFTERYLIRIRSCCGNGCRHCPYEPKHMGGSKQIRDELNKKLNNRM